MTTRTKTQRTNVVLYLDPQLVDQVDTGPDDGFEIEDPGTMNIEDTTLYCASSASADSRWWSAFRFHKGPFPALGASILYAYLEICALTSYRNMNADVYAEDAAAPATLSANDHDITNRVRTTASVPWVEDNMQYAWVNSPPLVSVIQELVNSYSVTAIAIILTVGLGWVYLAYTASDASGRMLVIWAKQWLVRVQPEVEGVVAQEAAGVDTGRELFPGATLHRRQVLPADLRLPLGPLGQSRKTSLPQYVYCLLYVPVRFLKRLLAFQHSRAGALAKLLH
jgi:hypothetical protein